MNGAYPVDAATERFFFAETLRKSWRALLCARFRRALRLFRRTPCVQFIALPTKHFVTDEIVSTAVHRFEESIAGRPYLIEVAAVSKDRWRAYIVRLPGVPTALMPFYGATPSEAAHHLRDWLARAHARAAGPAGSV